jgi:hypothetical protein
MDDVIKPGKTLVLTCSRCNLMERYEILNTVVHIGLGAMSLAVSGEKFGGDVSGGVWREVWW